MVPAGALFAEARPDVVLGRPWPAPRGPWIMAQVWHDLLFAHWPLPPEVLRSAIPRTLPLDTFDGQAWIGVVPFRMTGVRPRGVRPLPWVSAFPELNVRTYVTLGGKAGVFFLSLDAGNRLAVAAARATYFLPYYHARIRLTLDGDAIRYRSQRIHRGAPSAELTARYWPTGPVRYATPGSLDAWLTERYCLYAVGPSGRVYRGEIDHVPWPLQPAAAEFEVNTMAAARGIDLPAVPPLLHFARRLDVRVWPLGLVPRAELRRA